MSLLVRFANKIKTKISIFLEKPTNQGIIFFVIGILTLSFGAWRIVDTIRSPFALDISDTQDTVATEQIQIAVQDEIKNLSALQAKDTDLDGLSDYDELYIYNTSPYVEDTDSDGYGDKTEITTGNNPICRAGEKCLFSSVDATGDTSAIGADNLASPPNPYAMTATEIRELLVQTGASEADLEQVDDETLRQMFQEVYSEVEQTSGATVNSVDINTETTVTKEYTPAELRELLLENGVTKEQVDAVTDEELTQLYQEIISTNN